MTKTNKEWWILPVVMLKNGDISSDKTPLPTARRAWFCTKESPGRSLTPLSSPFIYLSGPSTSPIPSPVTLELLTTRSNLPLGPFQGQQLCPSTIYHSPPKTSPTLPGQSSTSHNNLHIYVPLQSWQGRSQVEPTSIYLYTSTKFHAMISEKSALMVIKRNYVEKSLSFLLRVIQNKILFSTCRSYPSSV